MATTWDYAVALDRVGGDTALLAELTAIFFDDYPEQVASLQQSLEQKNFIALRKTAHTLKGSLGYLGATEGVRLAVEIERASMVGDIESLPNLLGNLKGAVEVLRKQMFSFGEHKRGDSRS